MFQLIEVNDSLFRRTKATFTDKSFALHTVVVVLINLFQVDTASIWSEITSQKDAYKQKMITVYRCILW